MQWEEGTHALQIELWMISHPTFKGHVSAIHHYTAAKRLLWPRLDEHRWAKLCFDKMVENKSCVLMGCASSGKTHTAAVFCLIHYFASPDDTCILVSSTQVQSLKKRIWSEITTLWEEAVGCFDFLPGHMLDSAIAITTETLDDVDHDDRKARDMRKGIFGVACVQGGKFVGLSRYMGIKQKNMVLCSDEMSAMSSAFVSAVSNLNANENFRFIGMGNPNDLHDPLGKISEPPGGWQQEHLEPPKTTFWKTRFLNGVCVNLVGYDSPNFDFPANEPTRYKYLISKEKIADILSFFTEDSVEHYSMGKGVMKIGLVAKRVLTRNLCDKNEAQRMAVWENDNHILIYFVDAAYGGDRCIGGHGILGKEVGGKMVLSFGIPKNIPVKVGVDMDPEFQIAEFVVKDCGELGIPPENMGHDATGRGSLGTALADVWKSAKAHPIESGGRPSTRPVSLDLYITDEETKQRRLKRCDEHFDRRVSEYAFSLRYAVESGQICDLPDEAMEELCNRKWDLVRGDLIGIEPKSGTATKPAFKERYGRSPDVGDWACGIVEMARRLGFQISKLSNESLVKQAGPNWTHLYHRRAQKLITSRQLQST